MCLLKSEPYGKEKVSIIGFMKKIGPDKKFSMAWKPKLKYQLSIVCSLIFDKVENVLKIIN